MKKSEIEVPAPVWKKACAYVIDALVVSFIIVLPMSNFYPRTAVKAESFADIWSSVKQTSGKTMVISLVIALLTILYWAILEYKIGQTIGKALMKIRVRSVIGHLSFKQCFIRNITKASTMLLVLDTLYILKSGSRRYFDKLAQTEVIEFAAQKKK